LPTAAACPAGASRFAICVGGHAVEMRVIRGVSLPAVWIIVGVVVAAIYDYFDSLGTVGRVLTAVVAVLFWPMLLFGYDVRVSR
jgi:hypothetical protein